ncbi:alkaline phosphatase family protein [Bradyrhizobium sp. CW10]|uniref:alkaline phosphatase family protein n=1 Tax=Bradyrhizobium sp. CW10 TaxID=2782683 RepID=UPI001FF96592|nr:alkaline phosphatase family protein [Bradyrhizobium sp. CW10]MCK1465851.1 alkaline phosphatase family protein [Bradyrhizobium sp. CW10]
MFDRPNRDRVLIVLFDGLRPDLVKPSLTPNLVSLQRPRCGAGRQRTVSPSETRIALTSLVTGATPDRHGIIEINISTGSRPYRALSTRAMRA